MKTDGNKMKFRISPTLILALLAIVAGGAAFWSAQRYLVQNTSSVRDRYEQRYRPRAVLVAARDIAAGTKLKTADLARRPMPEGFLPSGTLSEHETGAAVGRRLLAPLRAGDPLVAALVEPEHAAPLAQRLESGSRAVTVPVDEVSSQAGLVRPGDRVDLMLAEERLQGSERCVVVTSLLESLHVLATGRATREAMLKASAMPGGADPFDQSYSTITLDVTPEQAQQLAVGLRMGDLIPMLRGSGDENPTRLAALGTGRKGCRAEESPRTAAPAGNGVAIDIMVGGTTPLAFARHWVADSDR